VPSFPSKLPQAATDLILVSLRETIKKKNGWPEACRVSREGLGAGPRGQRLHSVKLPAVSDPVPAADVLCFERLFPLQARRELGPELLADSQLLIVNLRRLEQTTNLLPPLHVGSLGISLLLLLLDNVKLRVVAGKLLEGDEEIPEVQSELVVLRVEVEESLYEARNLRPNPCTLARTLQSAASLEKNLRLQVGERVAKQGRDRVAQEVLVGGSRLRLIGSVDGALDLGLRPVRRLDEVEQLHQQHRLSLEPSFVVAIRDHEQHILQDCGEEALEECVGCGNVRLVGNVVDELQAHVEACRLDVSVVMLECPRAGIDDELELVVVELQQGYNYISNRARVSATEVHTWEAVQVNGPQQVKELDSVFGEFGKVLVDHVEGALEHILHDGRDLVLHERLVAVSA